MLAIFHKTVASGPEGLSSPNTGGCSFSDLVAKFLEGNEQSVCLKFDEMSCMAYTHQGQPLLSPRSFASVDGIFCIFKGGLENLAGLRQRYGLSKCVNEALLVIEAYRALRDRAPYPPHHVVGDLNGRFAFILYDNNTRKIFAAADCHAKVSMYWGTTSDGAVAFSDDEGLIKEACHRSFASFPQGCYFSSDDGLMSFEHPLKEVMAVPRVDSEGQAYGSTFIVDTQKRISRARSGSWGVV